MAGISTESSNGNADVSREDFYVNAAVYWEVRFPGLILAHGHVRLLRNHYPKCVLPSKLAFHTSQCTTYGIYCTRGG